MRKKLPIDSMGFESLLLVLRKMLSRIAWKEETMGTPIGCITSRKKSEGTVARSGSSAEAKLLKAVNNRQLAMASLYFLMIKQKFIACLVKLN